MKFSISGATLDVDIAGNAVAWCSSVSAGAPFRLFDVLSVLWRGLGLLTQQRAIWTAEERFFRSPFLSNFASSPLILACRLSPQMVRPQIAAMVVNLIYVINRINVLLECRNARPFTNTRPPHVLGCVLPIRLPFPNHVVLCAVWMLIACESLRLTDVAAHKLRASATTGGVERLIRSPTKKTPISNPSMWPKKGFRKRHPPTRDFVFAPEKGPLDPHSVAQYGPHRVAIYCWCPCSTVAIQLRGLGEHFRETIHMRTSVVQ